MNEQGQVEPQVYSFDEFFTEKAVFPVCIDSYQRPYVWDTDDVQELINDLSEYLAQSNGLAYYMGNVLLHQNNVEKKLFIIDGQQRLTTLSILYYVLNEKLIDSNKMAMEYHSPLSAQNIKQTQKLFERKKDKWKEQSTFLFSNIQFTFITTLSEDLAFTFFDTQNNRGVKLNPTDFLKAYHLRAIGNADHRDIQEDCARRWEKIQNKSTLFGQHKDFTAELFHQFLWRSRNWRGQQRVIYREDDDDMLTEFQKKSINSNSADTINLYPNPNNTLAKSLQLKVNQGYTLHTVNIEASNNSVHLPFTLRQPISKGLGFFLFSAKYADLVHMLLFDEDIKKPDIKAFRALYKDVWTKISLYLKELFVLASVMYYDKFDSEKLLEFTLWLDHVLGAVRIEKQSIYKEAITKFLKETDNNLLDIISQAFRPEEVILFIKSLTYYNEIYEKEEVIAGNGVQGVYKQNVLEYYKQTDFREKMDWINDDFIQRKLK
ncbi:DUF262 [Desulfonema limicola]|uniref:DUF262 n=1 Tax=Desulfonema limicola TaxID=45656 RepID=A0A975BC97_9BACT|nr:DUF262 domain-containing protein [Desulfonema limicola]QTA82712.1 DUF262 [Desulfonema limicola]